MLEHCISLPLHPSITPPPDMPRWHSCNVLQNGAEARHVWQFDARNSSFTLNREQVVRPGELLPATLVGKSWSSLWQPRLNVAWLPPENVFIRVAHFPPSSPEETRAMVELQLEKLSPIPVTQAVWTLHLLPDAPRLARRSDAEAGADAGAETAKMQTVAVTIAPRDAVEEFLGRLEGQGYMADRLEVPMLDQLQATVVEEDGAWIYPVPGGGNAALVAWWYGGVLQNIDLLTLPAAIDRAAGLKDQLMQLAWAGELEGWLARPPAWHLVADSATGKEWEPALRQGLDQPVQILPPLSTMDLAALTARRASQADPKINLLPAEFAARYRQKFVDRLWLRGLLAAVGLYFVGCLIYFIAVAVLSFQAAGVEKQVSELGGSYTNAIQIKDRYAVLKERQELKYAALDCWEATAELMPEGLTLDSLNFSDGKKLTVSGTGPAQQVTDIIDFSGKLRKHIVRGQPLFNLNGGDALHTQVAPGGATVNWNFGLELKRAEDR